MFGVACVAHGSVWTYAFLKLYPQMQALIKPRDGGVDYYKPCTIVVRVRIKPRMRRFSRTNCV